MTKMSGPRKNVGSQNLKEHFPKQQDGRTL